MALPPIDVILEGVGVAPDLNTNPTSDWNTSPMVVYAHILSNIFGWYRHMNVDPGTELTNAIVAALAAEAPPPAPPTSPPPVLHVVHPEPDPPVPRRGLRTRGQARRGAFHTGRDYLAIFNRPRRDLDYEGLGGIHTRLGVRCERIGDRKSSM